MKIRNNFRIRNSKSCIYTRINFLIIINRVKKKKKLHIWTPFKAEELKLKTFLIPPAVTEAAGDR